MANCHSDNLEAETINETEPVIYLAGPWERNEFARVHAAWTEQARIVLFSRTQELLGAVERGSCDPAYILLAQSRPGTYPQSLVERLRDVAPLTTVIVVLGSWCEGETRSGVPLGDVHRVPWYALPLGSCWRNDSSTVFQMPLTTGFDERLERELASCRSMPARRIAVYSADPSQAAALCESLRGFGHEAILANELADPQGCHAAVWDDAGGMRTTRIASVDFVRTFGFSRRMPRVALRTFPRSHQANRDRDAGFSATLPKPFHLAQLLRQLETAIALSGDQSTSRHAA